MKPTPNKTYMTIYTWLQTQLDELNFNAIKSGLITANATEIKTIPTKKRDDSSKAIFKITNTMIRLGLTSEEWDTVTSRIFAHLKANPNCRLKIPAKQATGETK